VFSHPDEAAQAPVLPPTPLLGGLALAVLLLLLVWLGVYPGPALATLAGLLGYRF
jgi:hypothetical protein